MSTLMVGDADFEDVPHLQLGERIFTVMHSAREAKIMIWIGAVIMTVCAGLFVSMDETLVLVGVFFVCFGPISLAIGIVQLRRSGKTTHVYQGGLVQRTKAGDELVFFGDITDAELMFTEMRGSLNFKLLLYTPRAVIQFTDSSSAMGIDNQNKMRALVQFIVDSLPERVTVEGTHAVERSPEPDEGEAPG